MRPTKNNSEKSKEKDKIMMKLEGRIAIVTGGATGIGRATALALAREGAKIVVADYSKVGQETVDLIKQESGEAVFIEADVTKAKDAEAIINKAIEQYGKIDILHNNAGVLKIADDISVTTEEDWDWMMDVNLKGVFLVSKYALPHMKANGSGVIINTASMTGVEIGMPGLAAYCASKAGVAGLTKVMALELAKYKIRVNAICPGVIDTELYNKEFLKDHSMEELQSGQKYMEGVIPLGRYGRPDELADAVVYLASDQASYITGQALVIDGGFATQ
jgi:NAD(P)-dependent dehydrogenase (short-subunit alcohol dehydrogenase family)